ncbi:hypothetical protein GCM10022200_05560 [Microbacterium awajiense]|uniref:Uncharacterized protein n=1 Tax=Microbacterium awajiense TaxID=415214 RepID=A0ABP7A6X0_9MICO
MTATARAVPFLRWLADRIEQGGHRQIATDCRRIADDIEMEARVHAAFQTPGICPCGRQLPPRLPGSGRNRLYCLTCRPRKKEPKKSIPA